MTVLETLMRTRNALSDPDRWAQGDHVYPVDGKNCMVTALRKTEAADGPWNDRAMKVLCGVTGARPGKLHRWNDSHTHAQVLAAFDRAIEIEWALAQGASEPVEAVPA